MSRNIGWVVNLLILIIGLVFLQQSWGIPTGGSDSVGPRAVPLVISLIVVFLSLCIMVVNLLRPDIPAKDDEITVRNLTLESGPLMLLVAVYAQLFYWSGYLASTFIIALLVFRLFSNSWKLSLANAAGGSLIFYLVFIKGMGIYDPPGALVDISQLLIR
ncbi:tripartite tricarboxylate transporter TctB family protein [Granulosicoccus sp. 3-233]|uniref:tripartite tricarboxylate transporter TctB family protein n=1 Tax=Granulosicoccus sp. 3-233 TaxID=3417969 RepID=UPI003D32C762